MTHNRFDTPMDLSGKTALVTGGTRGIGLAIAEVLLRAGAKLYVTSRHAASCIDAVNQLTRYGSVTAIAADLAEPAEMAKLVASLSVHARKLHLLVNAMTRPPAPPASPLEAGGGTRVLHLNVRWTYLLAQQLAPLLQAGSSAGDPARVINIAAQAQLAGQPQSAYLDSVGMVHHLTRHMALGLAPARINVNSIVPGETQHEPASPGGAEAGDIAGTVLFLSSAVSASINGAVIPLDGHFAARD